MFSKPFDRVVFVQEGLKVEDSYRRGGSFVGSAGRSIVKGRDLSQSQGSATLFLETTLWVCEQTQQCS